MKLVAVSGSLRIDSINSVLIQALPALAPFGMSVSFFNGIVLLPHYSPEIDTDTPPAPVTAWRDALRAADAVLFSTPEYAHGMPGSLKNALDWLVSSGEFDGGKPACALSASPSFLGGDKALSWLRQTLAVLGAIVPPDAVFPIPFVRSKLGTDGQISDPALADSVRAALQSLADAAERRAAPLQTP